MASKAAHSRADATVLPTLVSVPVTKKRLGMGGFGGRGCSQRGGCNRAGQTTDLFERDGARERQTKASRPGRHGRWTDRFHGVAIGPELGRNIERSFIFSEDNRNDLRPARPATDPSCRKTLAKGSRNRLEVRSPVIGFANKIQGRSNLASQVRRHGRAKDECPGVVNQVVSQILPPTHECACARKCFTASVKGSKNIFLDSEPGDEPASLRAVHASR